VSAVNLPGVWLLPINGLAVMLKSGLPGVSVLDSALLGPIAGWAPEMRENSLPAVASADRGPGRCDRVSVRCRLCFLWSGHGRVDLLRAGGRARTTLVVRLASSVRRGTKSTSDSEYGSDTVQPAR